MQGIQNLIPAQIMSAHGSEPPMSREEYEQFKVDSYNETEGNLHLADGYDCPFCKNRGYIAKLEHNPVYGYGVEVLAKCKCHKARNAIARLFRSGLAAVVKKYTFDNYQTPEEWHNKIKEAAQRFCDGKASCFFIGGQSGAGKTHICTAISVHFIRQGKESMYMVWPEELPKIQAVVNDPVAYDAKMNELKNADVLYIDDLFKHGKDEYGRVKDPTAAEVHRAFEIINARYNNPERITIISSERTLSELHEIDAAIAGRIAEMSKEKGFCFNLRPDDKKNWRMQGLIEL